LSAKDLGGEILQSFTQASSSSPQPVSELVRQLSHSAVLGLPMQTLLAQAEAQAPSHWQLVKDS